ncbi:MAG: phosphoethanolamine--lipid A transferase, partial [Gammaproteobacteria bacterium]|nr:phosphoethanolamine--lipid A transferase [Gammaproteobacteria bacterium]
KLSETNLILLVSLFITAFHNNRFFTNIADAYGPGTDTWEPLALIGGLHFGLLLIVLLILTIGPWLRWLLAMTLVFSSATAYFIDTYNIIIDADMIDNSLKTDAGEIRDLLAPMQLFYILLLGVLPAWLVIRIPTHPNPWKTRLYKRLASVLVTCMLVGVAVFSYADFFASYLRQEKILRYYNNPIAPVYGAYRFIEGQTLYNHTQELQIIADQAQRKTTGSKPKLTIVVVGETVRADHFGLNGYERNTTPLLAQHTGVVNFTQVTSCGTSTAYSLPCMFSYLERRNFDKQQAKYTENVLDILAKTGVDVLWLDNNSSSKGVADRVTYRNLKTPALNPLCDPECRDPGMLSEAVKWLDESQNNNDKLLILHQMGSHGPAYYKRYPKAFEVFKDTCQSNQLDTCSRQSIINAYDNTIVYTDYFLSLSIQWLQQSWAEYDVAMLYVSDHGESLGENGLYLHGYPYLFAPKAQIQIPMFIWANKQHQTIHLDQLAAHTNQPLSHDNLFHTLLGLHEVDTTVYKPEMDILRLTD